MKEEKLIKFTKADLIEMLFRLNEKVNYIQNQNSKQKELMEDLVHQNNALLKFLASLEVEERDPYGNVESRDLLDYQEEYTSNPTKVLELAKSLIDKTEDLKEFEEELKKHKDKLTPGQVGES